MSPEFIVMQNIVLLEPIRLIFLIVFPLIALGWFFRSINKDSR